MKCVVCGGSRENFDFRRGPHTIVCDGVRVRLLDRLFLKCPFCKDEAVEIPHLDGLCMLVEEECARAIEESPSSAKPELLILTHNGTRWKLVDELEQA